MRISKVPPWSVVFGFAVFYNAVIERSAWATTLCVALLVTSIVVPTTLDHLKIKFAKSRCGR